MQGFKHILAWQRAHKLSIDIHRVVAGFSRRGFGNLRGQLIRSSESMASTIAEGCGASTNREFARFLDMSIKSANETEHHLLNARDHGLISRELWSRLTDETVEIRKMTFGYRRKVIESGDGDQTH